MYKPQNPDQNACVGLCLEDAREHLLLVFVLQVFLQSFQRLPDFPFFITQDDFFIFIPDPGRPRQRKLRCFPVFRISLRGKEGRKRPLQFQNMEDQILVRDLFLQALKPQKNPLPFERKQFFIAGDHFPDEGMVVKAAEVGCEIPVPVMEEFEPPVQFMDIVLQGVVVYGKSVTNPKNCGSPSSYSLANTFSMISFFFREKSTPSPIVSDLSTPRR